MMTVDEFPVWCFGFGNAIWMMGMADVCMCGHAVANIKTLPNIHNHKNGPNPIINENGMRTEMDKTRYV